MEVVTFGTVLRGDVFLVELSPTRGSEIKKTRPCLIVSPDDLNANLKAFIVAPLTTGAYPYPFRVPCRFAGKNGHVVLDQIRNVALERLVRRLGRLNPTVLQTALTTLREMFAP
jgi:mRNA interferase MazF